MKLVRIEECFSSGGEKRMGINLVRSIIDLRWIQSIFLLDPLVFLFNLPLGYARLPRDTLILFLFQFFPLTPRPWRAQPSLHLAPCHFFFFSTLPSLLNQPTQTNEPTSNWGLSEVIQRQRKDRGTGYFQTGTPASFMNVMRSKQLILFSCLFCRHNASIAYATIVADWL